MAPVTELVTKFTFIGSLDPLENFNEGLGSSITLMAGAGAGLIAIAGIMNTFVVQTLAGADAVGQLARNTGVAVETIQELGFAASVTGSDAQAMEGTIDSLSKTIGDAAQKGSEDFARLGISVRKSNGEVKKADEIFDEVGQRFRTLKLSLAEKQSFASSLGIDPSLIQLLNKTSGEMFTLRKRARELGIVNQEQQEGIIDFNNSLTTLKFGLSAVQKQVAIGLAPTIKNMAEGFTDFLAANKDLVINGLVFVGDGINALLGFLDRMKFVLAAMIGLFIALKIATIGWGAVMAIVFSPVVLITAGIAALLLIVDDLIVAFQGGKSVIGDFFQEFFGIDITPILKTFVSDFLFGIKQIGKALKLLFDLFLKPLIDGLGTIGRKIGNFFGGKKLSGLPQTIPPGAPAGSQSSSVDNSIRQENFFDIKGDNPQQIADDVGTVLDRQLADADNQLGRGGR